MKVINLNNSNNYSGNFCQNKLPEKIIGIPNKVSVMTRNEDEEYGDLNLSDTDEGFAISHQPV